MKIFIQLLLAVKAHIPPLEFYSSELSGMPQPNGSGWTDGGFCPFHEDHNTGSFRTNLQTGAFRCFSCGARGGDIIAFTQLRDTLSFPDAVKKLADDWGV